MEHLASKEEEVETTTEEEARVLTLTPSNHRRVSYKGDELDVYTSKMLLSITIKTAPTTAFENKAFVAYVISQIGGIDRSANDILTKWIKECLDIHNYAQRATLEDIISLFHNNSGGFPLLDKHIGRIMLENEENFKPNMPCANSFRSYQLWCNQQGTAARGRVLFAILVVRFRIEKGRSDVAHLHKLHTLELPDYKISSIQSFLEQIKSITINLDMEDLKQLEHKFWYDWLFYKFQNWRQIEREVREMRRSDYDSPLRSFNRLFNLIQETVLESFEDANQRSIFQHSTPKAPPKATPAQAQDDEEEWWWYDAEEYYDESGTQATPGQVKGKKGRKGKGKGKKGKGKGDEKDQGKNQQRSANTATPSAPSPELLAARKQTACRNMLRHGNCQHGDKCHFSHATEVIAKAKKEATAKAAEEEPQPDLNAELIGEGEPANATVATITGSAQTGLLGVIAASTLQPSGASATSSFRPQGSSGENSYASPDSASVQESVHSNSFQSVEAFVAKGVHSLNSWLSADSDFSDQDESELDNFDQPQAKSNINNRSVVYPSSKPSHSCPPLATTPCHSFASSIFGRTVIQVALLINAFTGPLAHPPLSSGIAPTMLESHPNLTYANGHLQLFPTTFGGQNEARMATLGAQTDTKNVAQTCANGSQHFFSEVATKLQI